MGCCTRLLSPWVGCWGLGLPSVDIIGTLNGDVIYDLIPEAGGLIDALMLQRAGAGM